MPSLPTTYAEVGDTVIEKAHPDQKWKVLAVFFNRILGIEYAYLENVDTKEKVYARLDDYTEIDQEDQALWRDSWKPADTPLSSELLVLKKSASAVSDQDRSLVGVILLPYLTRKAGIGTETMEQFLAGAEYTRSGNQLFVTLGNRTLVATFENNEVVDVRYIRKNAETTAPTFFNDQRLVLYAVNPGYALEVDGTQTYLDEEDLAEFCDDWNLSLNNVKASLTKNGRYTVSQE